VRKLCRGRIYEVQEAPKEPTYPYPIELRTLKERDLAATSYAEPYHPCLEALTTGKLLSLDDRSDRSLMQSTNILCNVSVHIYGMFRVYDTLNMNTRTHNSK